MLVADSSERLTEDGAAWDGDVGNFGAERPDDAAKHDGAWVFAADEALVIDRIDFFPGEG